MADDNEHDVDLQAAARKHEAEQGETRIKLECPCGGLFAPRLMLDTDEDYRPNRFGGILGRVK